MRRAVSGWFLAVTGFLVCPCHLVITLPLVAALLSGTVLGGWIAGHQAAIIVGASIYFVGALAAGATLLLAGKGAIASTAGQRQEVSSDRARSTIGADCCAPVDDIPDEAAHRASAGSTTGAEATRLLSHEAMETREDARPTHSNTNPV